MAFTADAIIANIESRLGDSGAHVWGFYRLASGTSWCVGEVDYTFQMTGNKNKFRLPPTFYVPTAQIWMAKHYKTIYDYRSGGDLGKVRKGDVIVFMWTRGSRDHIGFARSTGSSKELYTIEGNTSGGKVAKRTRAKKYIYGVYRPPYQESVAPVKPKPAKKKKKTPKTLPTYTKGRIYTVAVDCLNVRTGPGTAYRAKTRSQLTADGKKHANSRGQLMKGTRATCVASKTVGGEVWIRIPSGWICAWNGKKHYVK